MTTQRQKKAIDKTLENGGNITKAMRDVGYSEATINNPKNLTESKAFKSIAQQIPDKLLVKKHLELLNVPKIKRTRVVSKSGDETTYEEEEETDVQALKAGLDMAYKLKGNYAPEKTINLNIEAEIKDPKARELANEYEKKLKETL